MYVTPDVSLYSLLVWGQHELWLKVPSTSAHLRTPPLPKPPWLLTLSCRLHWFSFTGIKTLAWILLTAQVFTANKNLRLQKHKKGWGCREVTPCWGASPVTQDVIWAQTSERLLSRRIQATREQSMFNSTVLSPLPHCLAFDEAK